jgi:hypothetical protein
MLPKLPDALMRSNFMEATFPRPNVAITLFEGLPPTFDMEVAQMLEGSGLDIPVIRTRGGPFAGVELYMPAAVMLFIASGYFNGFLQKAGEDHYELLKRIALYAWRRASAIRLTALGKKTDRRFSMSYAIGGESPDGTRFKLLVQMEITEDDASEAIAAFLEFLRALHNGTVTEADLKALLTYPVIGGTALVTFDPRTKKIVPVNAFEK